MKIPKNITDITNKIYKNVKKMPKNKKIILGTSVGLITLTTIIAPIATVMSYENNQKNIVDEKSRLDSAITDKSSTITMTQSSLPTKEEILSKLGFTISQGFKIEFTGSPIFNKDGSPTNITFIISQNDNKKTVTSKKLKVTWTSMKLNVLKKVMTNKIKNIMKIDKGTETQEQQTNVKLARKEFIKAKENTIKLINQATNTEKLYKLYSTQKKLINDKKRKIVSLIWSIQTQFTKYRINGGNEITASKHDLSSLVGENITITQIGFKKEKDGVVKMDSMPKNIISIPKLPYNITSIYRVFDECKSFNQDISNWDVFNVSNLGYLFYGCTSFNQDISKWDVFGVTSMNSMFRECESFNKPLKDWDVSNVKNMGHMFDGAKSFNKDISKWDVSKVIDISYIFNNAIKFNQDISNWNVSSVTDTSYAFSGCKVFNQPLNNWDLSKVKYTFGMFADCNKFNQDISNWNVSLVTDMQIMFWGCTIFNQDISKMRCI